MTGRPGVPTKVASTALARSGSGLVARYTTADRAGTVSSTSPSATTEPVAPYSASNVASGLSGENVAVLVVVALFTATRYSTRSSRSTRENAYTPVPSATNCSTCAPSTRAGWPARSAPSSAIASYSVPSVP